MCDHVSIAYLYACGCGVDLGIYLLITVSNVHWNLFTSDGKYILLRNLFTVYVPIDAHCASADLRVRVYLKKKKYIKKKKI